MLALDWMNGNRSVLVDVDLSGLILGITLATKPEDIYRALIEATAFGTRMIIESFTKSGVPVNEVVACGGLPEKNPMLMQMFADICHTPIIIAASSQTVALGAAMFGALAAGGQAGGFDTMDEAAAHMVQPSPHTYEPRPEVAEAYDRVYAEYAVLYDHFGKAEKMMHRLKALRSS